MIWNTDNYFGLFQSMVIADPVSTAAVTTTVLGT